MRVINKSIHFHNLQANLEEDIGQNNAALRILKQAYIYKNVATNSSKYLLLQRSGKPEKSCNIQGFGI